MRRTAAALSTVLSSTALLVATGAAPATAISSYGSQEATERTNVGALVVEWDDDGDGTLERKRWVCSGTVVDTDTFLTAAHCTTGWPVGTRFFVSLEQVIDQPALDAAVEGVPEQDPLFPGNARDSHDIAVIEMPAGTFAGVTPARLPAPGWLDELGPRALDAASWTVAGYGTQEAQRGPGGHRHPGGGTRLQAPVGFDALNKTWVRLKMAQSQGYGGACYGDSGGPNFLRHQGEEYLVSTTITGDVPCYATNVTYRLDSRSARAFLAPFVVLP